MSHVPVDTFVSVPLFLRWFDPHDWVFCYKEVSASGLITESIAKRLMVYVLLLKVILQVRPCAFSLHDIIQCFSSFFVKFESRHRPSLFIFGVRIILKRKGSRREKVWEIGIINRVRQASLHPSAPQPLLLESAFVLRLLSVLIYKLIRCGNSMHCIPACVTY